MTVRAAIIGLGRWGRSLVNAVHGKTDAIQFAAAYTRTKASAEDFCRERGIPLLDRFEDALTRRDIDAVVLATPHTLHAQQVMAAAVETGVKRKRARLGRENSARPLVPNSVKLKVVAVATEQNNSPVAPLANRSITLVVSSDGLPGM